MRLRSLCIPAALMTLLGAACSHTADDNPVPRPRAYHRLCVPPPAYITCDTLPLAPALPRAATVRAVTDPRSASTKLDIIYPGGTPAIHATILPARDPAHRDSILANRAERMALNAGSATTEVIDITLSDGGHARMLVTPVGSPTPVQFLAFCRDTVITGAAFLPGAATARTDSLSPVISYLRRDILHLINSIDRP